MSRRPKYIVDPELARLTAAATVDAAQLVPGMDRDLAIELELAILQTGLTIGSEVPGAKQDPIAYAAECGDYVSTVFRQSLEGFSGQWSIRLETFCKTPKCWVALGSVRMQLGNAKELAAALLQIVPEPGSEVAVQ